MTTMEINYNYKYILLSYLITFIGCYLSICLSEQLRINYRYFDSKKYIYIHRIIILCLLSLTLGCISIWCMNYMYLYSLSFIVDIDNNTISSTTLTTTNTIIIKLRYNIIKFIFSLLLSIILIFIGYFICHYDDFFKLCRKEIMEIFIEEKKQSLSLREIKKIGNMEIMKYLFFTKLNRIIFGSLLISCGYLSMFYLGKYKV